MKTGYILPVYNVGDKVRIVTTRKDEGQYVGVPPEMKENWFGRVVTITAVSHTTSSSPVYSVEENDWKWDNSLIEGLEVVFCDDDDSDIENASFGKYFDGFKIRA